MTRQYAAGRIHRTLTQGQTSFVAACGRQCWGTDTDTANWLNHLQLDGQHVMNKMHQLAPPCPACDQTLEEDE